jgi:hypothetical protein
VGNRTAEALRDGREVNADEGRACLPSNRQARSAAAAAEIHDGVAWSNAQSRYQALKGGPRKEGIGIGILRVVIAVGVPVERSRVALCCRAACDRLKWSARLGC